jgi:hypothetical protein
MSMLSVTMQTRWHCAGPELERKKPNTHAFRRIFAGHAFWLACSLCIAPATVRADKEAARDFYAGATVLGGLALLAPEPSLTKAAGVGACVGQGVGLVGMGIWDIFALAPTTPDTNYATVASVVPVIFTPVSGMGQAFDDINASLVLGGLVVDYSRLVDVSLQRYYGAVAASDASAALMQQVAASYFLSELESDMAAWRSSLQTVSAGVGGSPFATLTITQGDVLSFRDDVVTSGFPAWENFVFLEMQATPQELTLARAEVGLLTGNAIPSGLTGSVVFEQMASSMGQVNLSELLPKDFVVVPEIDPAGIGSVLALVTGVLAMIEQRRRRGAASTAIAA